MSEIKPALTAEEWVAGRFLRHDGSCPSLHNGDVVVDGCKVDGADERHALATLCLHGQPFGFTWDDVDRHREAANRDREIFHVAGLSDDPDDDYVESEAAQRIEWHESMADRIAALLPPR